MNTSPDNTPSPAAPAQQPARRIGVVAIGRNEGDRLRRCLESMRGIDALVVYVDSASTDRSVELARSMGVEVVELDMSIPFSAARARNAGFERLLARQPDTDYVQFLDGDCDLVPGWIDRARATLESRPDVAVVCGRRRERFPDATVYNTMCEMEWNTPVGEAKACGGDALMRAEALRKVGGYRPDVLAAEDDEVCLRIRREGWKVLRIDADMTIHDAAMTTFGQWWKRAKRAGQAYAQGNFLHGRSPDRHFARDCKRLWAWGLALPALAILPAWWTYGASLLLLGMYPVLGFKIYRGMRQRGWNPRQSRAYAVFTVIAKFPGLLGLVQFHWRRLQGRQSPLIEYKGAAKTA